MPLLRLAQLRQTAPIFRYQQNMHRRCWKDVTKRKAKIILIHNLCRYFSPNYFVEYGYLRWTIFFFVLLIVILTRFVQADSIPGLLQQSIQILSILLNYLTPPECERARCEQTILYRERSRGNMHSFDELFR